MFLKKMILKNFKGAEYFEIEFDKKSVIFGDNGTGKTTLIDAYLWALTGKDSEGYLDLVKPLDNSGNEIHQLETSVKLFFEDLEIKRVFVEKWTKKRNEVRKHYTGNTTKYFIDGVPQKKKDFDNEISEKFGENILLLSDIRFFNEKMNWKARRDLLIDLLKIDEQEILKQFPELENPEKEELVLKNQKKKINLELLKIPVKIEELQEQIKSLQSEDDLLQQEKEVKAEIDKLQKQIAELENGKNDVELAKKKLEAQENYLKFLNIVKEEEQVWKEKQEQKRVELINKSTELLMKRSSIWREFQKKNDDETKELRESLEINQKALTDCKQFLNEESSELERVNFAKKKIETEIEELNTELVLKQKKIKIFLLLKLALFVSKNYL